MKAGLPSPLFSSIRIFFYPVFLQRANVSQLSHWGKNVIYLPHGSRNLPGYRWGRSDAHGIGAPSCPVSQAAEFGDRRLGGWEAGRLGGWEAFSHLILPREPGPVDDSTDVPGLFPTFPLLQSFPCKAQASPLWILWPNIYDISVFSSVPQTQMPAGVKQVKPKWVKREPS